MIKVNKAMETSDGRILPSGFVEICKTSILPNSTVVIFECYFYKDQATAESEDAKPLPPITGLPRKYRRVLTVEEFTSLETETGTLTKFETWLSEEIEVYTGEGTTEIILPS